MNPELHKIKKIVASMEILSASSDTTHYKLLGVEETDDATKIRSAYRKLAIDSDEQSRAKFDHALAAARKTPHGGARNPAAREAATREADALSGESFSTDTSYTDASSTDDSSTNASFTDDVGPGVQTC
uniref:J domain-containing protein n=1 Tax=Tanacetum cinerariifolium TaxID=118510 RepID=A0A6L2N5T1_TANCI|nr:hypothetical protein [Tanacetum cinerariifolium]